MNLTLISVIIPTYNRQLSVVRAIYSVLAQTYRHVEIIVVDDASTDDTASVVKGLPIIYIRHDLNKGAAAARNTGIRHAKGDYVAFLDSDDTWLPEKLEKQLTFLKTCDHDIAGCITPYAMSNGRIRAISIEDNFFEQSLRECNLSLGSTPLFRKACLDKIGLQDETLKRYEDWEWQIRLAAHYRLAVLPEILVTITVGHFPTWSASAALLDLMKRQMGKSLHQQQIFETACLFELFFLAVRNKKIDQMVRYAKAGFTKNPSLFTKLCGRKILRLFGASPK